MREKRDKSNKKFMLLSAIGIFMVVDQHTFMAFNLLSDYLPYNSYFMPMFVFISGYFNKVDGNTNLWTYFIKKIKTLLLPYAGLSLTVFSLQQLINLIKLGADRPALPAGYLTFVLRRIVTEGTYGGIVTPMWFVIALFSSLMLYACLKKLLGKLWNSYVMFAVFCALHVFAVYFAKSADLVTMDYLLLPLKCLFFFPFLELGILYRDHLEKKHSAIPAGAKIAMLFLLLAINAIRMNYLPDAYDVAFDSLDVLTGFTSPYYVTPLVSSFIGILFWLTAVELVGKQVYESKLINYVSCNTFWIMGLHVCFFNIFNCILMGISQGIVSLPYFDVEAFRGSEWYFWGIGNNIKILYVIIGMIGPLGLKVLYDKINVIIGNKMQRKLAFVFLFLFSVCMITVLTQPKANGEGQISSGQTTEVDDGGLVGEGEDGGMDPEGNDPAEEKINPVYAYVDLIYEYNGTNAEYLAEPCSIYGNDTYTVIMRRTDDKDTPHAMDGLLYMGIRLLDNELSEIDVSHASITGIKVKSDGAELQVKESGTVPYEDGAMSIFFDCHDGGNGSEEETSEAPAHDFQGTEVIEVTFTISGADLSKAP